MREFKTIYTHGILEVSDVSGGCGWIIRIHETGLIKLYEITQCDENERFVDTYINIMLALKEALSWT